MKGATAGWLMLGTFLLGVAIGTLMNEVSHAQDANYKTLLADAQRQRDEWHASSDQWRDSCRQK